MLTICSKMKRLIIFYLLLIGFLSACHLKSKEDENAKRKAIVLNNEAVRIYTHSFFNNDSLNKALNLINSAILLRKDFNFYNNQYAIERRLKRYFLALSTCDTMLNLRNLDFNATLHKGFLFEDLNLKDSQTIYYHKAYALIDDPRSFNASDMVKDRQRIILKGLLYDTIDYQIMTKNFLKKYATSKIYRGIADEFRHFDRERFLEKL
jgi:hypothetical protein